MQYRTRPKLLGVTNIVTEMLLLLLSVQDNSFAFSFLQLGSKALHGCLCPTAPLPAHHLHASHEVGKLARGEKRAISIPLPLVAGVPSLSNKYRDTDKEAPSSAWTHTFF